MRRIIERVVTVVTTTTWKISWEPDSPHASSVHSADSVPEGLPNLDVLNESVQGAPITSLTSHVKEVDPPAIEPAPEPPAENPPQ